MQRMRRIADFLLMPIPAAVGFLIGGLVVFFGGFFLTQTRQDLFAIIEQGYSNFGIELLSIAATVIVIDSLNQRRTNRERLQELITQARSKDNGLALAALEILRLKGWLHNGALRGAYLEGANLESAFLAEADLQGARLGVGAASWAIGGQGANLRGANLLNATLRDADLVNTNLQDANMLETDLRGATLVGADLSGAELNGTRLESAILVNANLAEALIVDADFDAHTALPDGTNWTPDTDMDRFTNPKHPHFWRSDNPVSPAYGE